MSNLLLTSFNNCLGPTLLDPSISIDETLESDRFTITLESIQNFVHAVGYQNESSIGRSVADIVAPVDYAIVVAWKVVVKPPLFGESLGGNLLDLVHLSNSFEMVSGATPLKVGETVLTISRVTAVANQDTGPMVEVEEPCSARTPQLSKLSPDSFFGANSSTLVKPLKRKLRCLMRCTWIAQLTDVVSLMSMPRVHLQLEDPERNILNKALEFHLPTSNYFKGRDQLEIIKTSGDIMMQLLSGNTAKIGSVKYSVGTPCRNGVLDYHQRYGTPIQCAASLKNPTPSLAKMTLGLYSSHQFQTRYTLTLQVTLTLSMSPAFSQYVNLPGTITHGMWTSAAVRNLLEVINGHASQVRS